MSADVETAEADRETPTTDTSDASAANAEEASAEPAGAKRTDVDDSDAEGADAEEAVTAQPDSAGDGEAGADVENVKPERRTAKATDAEGKTAEGKTAEGKGAEDAKGSKGSENVKGSKDVKDAKGSEDAKGSDTEANGADGADGADGVNSADGEDSRGGSGSADADAGADGGGKRAGRGRPGRGALVRAAGALVLAAAVATAGLQWYRADQAAGEEVARAAVEKRAGEFGQALLSYDHEHLQDARNRVLALSSEDFAKTYDVAFTGGLEGVITKLKADASATVRAVYLGDVDESSARAIVVLDSEVRSSAGTRRVLGSHLDMKLERKDGAWRVSEVTSIGAAQETMTDPEGRQQGSGGGAVVPTPGASPAE
ncbi:hypothetical protein [Actinomadura sp. WMMB 499]|uniref:hypothetical protein n=1 Tax=Actinomadura sp. WMMB 499 TaxID=1219491 RepID=UPI001247BCC4|nr:hypothetical protein [Actinomadura sp. WMMB 499]QFG22335.1 hypothetical protein F7P10_15570 [Actinomadura sp. WMMB 499]